MAAWEEHRRGPAGPPVRTTVGAGDSSTVGLIDLDINGRVLRMDERAAALLGRQGVRRNIPLAGLFDARNAAGVTSLLDDARNLGGPHGVDLSVTAADGSARTIYVVATPIPAIEGSGLALRLAILDVSDRKVREDRLERQAALHALVAETGQYVLTNPTRGELFERVVERVARALDAPWVLILELLHDGSGLLPRSARGFGREAATWRLAPGEHPAAEDVLTTGRPARYADIRLAAPARFPDVFLQRGTVSGLIIPIRGDEDGRPFGTLEIYRPDRDGVGEPEAKFVEAIANLVGAYLRQRQLEDHLRESEARFRQVVESTVIGFSIVQDGEVVFANPPQRRILGSPTIPLPLEELESKLHPADASLYRACLASVLDGTSDRREADLRLVGADTGNQVLWVQLRMSGIPWHGRNAVLVSMTDVSRTKRLEAITLNQERMATLGKAATGMAHEVRSPLSALNIRVGRLRKMLDGMPDLDPQPREAAVQELAKVAAAAASIENVIRRALDFARPLALPMAPLHINELVRESLGIAESMLSKAGVEVILSLGEDLPQCRGDKQLLTQVLLNILSNAVQAMEEFHGGRTMQIASTFKNGELAISIGDAGPGVPEELRERIFEPFFTTRSSGTGIGLSISRKIVTEHGGRLRVGRSEAGGALFTVSLSALRSPEPEPATG
jgi:PAS domain S-box-containing protein